MASGSAWNVKSAITSEAINVNPISDITTASTLSGSKAGNVIIISVDLIYTGTTGSGWVKVGTVETKYVPTGRVYGIVYRATNSTVVQAVVERNGDIKILNATNNNEYWGTLCYTL